MMDPHIVFALNCLRSRRMWGMWARRSAWPWVMYVEGWVCTCMIQKGGVGSVPMPPPTGSTAGPHGSPNQGPMLVLT